MCTINEVRVLKKDGNTEHFDGKKIIEAVKKSAVRVSVTLTEEQLNRVVQEVEDEVEIRALVNVTVEKLHSFVENALLRVDKQVAESYRNYRNYKMEFSSMMNEVYEDYERFTFHGDRENGNRNSALSSTNGALLAGTTYKALYKETFLTNEEKKLCKEGDMYVHDMADRLKCAVNCCLHRTGEVLKGGFEMGEMWYTEPKSLDVAFDVISDETLACASQQYGGFTIPQIDKILSPYAEKSYKAYFEELKSYGLSDEDADKKAVEKVKNDYKQGFQGLEYKFNTVASSRGDYPFITVTAGLDTSRFGIIGNIVMFENHMNGQGKKGNKIPALFPKYVFLYDKELHGEGKPLYEVFLAGLKCSRKTMYPDWLSLTGEGYVAEMYKKYGKVISPMGCRAFLSPWFVTGRLEEDGTRNHFYPAEDCEDEPVFEGRFNAGAISFNLPLIYLRSKVEGVDFFELLLKRMEQMRSIHKRTRVAIGNKYASSNPLAFTQGGLHGGNLNYNQRIKESFELMDSTTYSFGITALDELQKAYNGKSLVEDGEFALKVLTFINDTANRFKDEDHMLYAIYGTPAENLCGLQIRQLRNYISEHVSELRNCGFEVKKTEAGYVIPNVCDHEYVSNSFHCNVREDISPIQKQDLEKRFWDLCNGGKIQYVRYPLGYNEKALETLILRAMDMGFYEGCNMALSYCNDCGHEELDMDVCPCCNSKNLTKIDRMNGYLAYSRVRGNTRLNDAKMAEIGERRSM